MFTCIPISYVRELFYLDELARLRRFSDRPPFREGLKEKPQRLIRWAGECFLVSTPEIKHALQRGAWLDNQSCPRSGPSGPAGWGENASGTLGEGGVTPPVEGAELDLRSLALPEWPSSPVGVTGT